MNEVGGELRFARGERRSLLVPVLLALLAIVLGLWGWTRLFPGGTVTLENVRTELVPTHTVFGSDSIVVGAAQAQDELYVAETVRLRNPLRIPVTVDDMTCTLTDESGAEMTVSAVGENDVKSVETSFPQIKPVMAVPLMRERTVAAGQAVEGTVLFHFPLTRSRWDARRSAEVKIGLYHREPVSVMLPKEAGR